MEFNVIHFKRKYVQNLYTTIRLRTLEKGQFSRLVNSVNTKSYYYAYPSANEFSKNNNFDTFTYEILHKHDSISERNIFSSKNCGLCRVIYIKKYFFFNYDISFSLV